MARAVAGENLFVTGGAGTGKTETLRRIYRELRSAHGEDAVALTATTGMAAKRLGGRTLANFAGWGAVDPLSITATEVLRRVQANAKAVARWRQTKTLIIDEISVMHGRMVDIMNCLAKYLRGNRSTSFGGLQVISGGDFFQLPPVVEDDEEGKAMPPSLVEWAFESGTWAKEKAVSAALLTRVFRQSDEEFVGILNKLRVGAAGAAEWKRLEVLAAKQQLSKKAVYLRPLRESVDEKNVSEFARLGSPVRRCVKCNTNSRLSKCLRSCASAGDVMVGLDGAGIPKPS